MTSDDFSAHVEEATSGCWTWTGRTSPSSPYGRFRLNGRIVYAHRFAYEATYGLIPTGLLVLHRCDNPPCVNPRHLWLGTDADNHRDKARKGRAAHNGKLTAGDIPLILASAAVGQTPAALAERFAVTKRTIRRVLDGRTWQFHVA